MTNNEKVNVICAVMAALGILLILISNTATEGKIIFLLLIALAVACSVATYRKLNAGKREREIINRQFKAELEELRREGVDT